MKWNTTNYKGDEVVWYSGDVIEEIKEHCTNLFQICNCYPINTAVQIISNRCGNCGNKTARLLAQYIIDIIEREDKESCIE